MRKSLVFKLFMFTFALSIGFFVFVIGTQTLFFERFYQQMKTRELATQIKRYEEATNLAQELYLEYGIWVTTLDSQGTIADMSGYRITVRPENTEEELEIPLYAMIGEFGAGEALLLSKGEKVVIDAVEKDSHMTVYQLASENGAVSLVNTTLAEKLHGNTADTKYKEVKTVCFQVEIVATDLPSNIDEIPYLFQEQSFLEQIKQFQATLLATEGTKMLQEQSYYMSSNLSEYEVLIKPEIQKGEKKYIFAMISLQPVDEAVAILRQFSLLFFIVILILALVAALVYSKWLAKPLLLANRVTKKMTKLDFSEKLLVRSQDEIGQLAANINYLSDELEQHICYLQKELEREQQLEKTRKKFISNVSHELKTPLAVMKSTISILEDDIAKEKKEYYFSAMENKIDEMNALIMEMLDLAKMESGTYKPELVPFALDKTIITVCEAFRSAMEPVPVYMCQIPFLPGLTFP